MNYKKNDLYDEAYSRSLESFDLTINTEEKTGEEVYRYYVGVLYKGLKSDVKDIKRINKKYNRFKLKEIKHQIRLEKLGFGAFVEEDGFVETSPEELEVELNTKRQIKRFRKRCRKYAKENRRFIRIIRKYRRYLGEDEYVELKETEENEAQGASAEPINVENIVSGSTAVDTSLSAIDDGAKAPTAKQEEKAEEKNEASHVEDVGCEVEEKQIDEKLEAFFDKDEDCGENEENEEENGENLDLQKPG